jgi:hypothetical protein
MKAFISTLLVTHALRTSAFTALFLGLVAMAPANAQELLLDGGFEGGYYSEPGLIGGCSFKIQASGQTGPWVWSQSPSTSEPITNDYCLGTPYGDPAHTGHFYVKWSATSYTSALYQTVTIPSGVNVSLSLWVKIGTTETTTSAFDTMKISIADTTSGAQLFGMMYSNLDTTNAWVQHTYDVSAIAGRKIRLQFDIYEDGNSLTQFMVDDVSILASASNPSGPTTTYLLPSSAHATGINAFYTTDLTVANRGTTDANITLQFLGHDRDGTTGPNQPRTLAANKAVTYADILGSVFGVNATDFQNYGAILVTADSASLKIVSQTSTPPANGVGTFGQSVPAQGANDFVTPASPKSLVSLREDAAFRTNVVLANVTTSSVTVTLTLLAADGSTLGTTTRTLPPLGMTQVGHVVTTLGAPFGTTNAVLVVSTATNGAQVATYASVIDNNTSDPRTILP